MHHCQIEERAHPELVPAVVSKVSGQLDAAASAHPVLRKEANILGVTEGVMEGSQGQAVCLDRSDRSGVTIKATSAVF